MDKKTIRSHRERTLELESELSTLRAQLAAVTEALGKLSAVLHKLDAPDSAMNGVFTFAAIHRYFYTGPQWGEALKQADAALTPNLAALAAEAEKMSLSAAGTPAPQSRELREGSSVDYLSCPDSRLNLPTTT